MAIFVDWPSTVTLPPSTSTPYRARSAVMSSTPAALTGIVTDETIRLIGLIEWLCARFFAIFLAVCARVANFTQKIKFTLMKKFMMIGLALALGALGTVRAAEPVAKASLSTQDATMGRSVNYTIDVKAPFTVDSVKVINSFTLDGCVIDEKKLKFKPKPVKKEPGTYEFRLVKLSITPQHVGRYIIPAVGIRLYTSVKGEDGQPQVIFHDIKAPSVFFNAAGYRYETHSNHRAYGS